MKDLLYILMLVIGVSGATMFVVGYLSALVTTLGMNRKLGIATIILIFIPIANIVFFFVPVAYCIKHRKEAGYPLLLLAAGFCLMLVGVVAVYLRQQALL